MTEKDKGWIEDEYELDITEIGKSKKKREEKKKDFPDEDTSIEEYLKSKKRQAEENTTVHIPFNVLKNLPNARTKWEAIQDWIIEENALIIIKKAIWIVTKAMEQEPEPKPERTSIEDLTEANPLFQDGAIQRTLEKINYTNTAINRLAELYGTIHEEAIQKAYESIESEEIQAFRQRLREREKQIEEMTKDYQYTKQWMKDEANKALEQKSREYEKLIEKTKKNQWEEYTTQIEKAREEAHKQEEEAQSLAIALKQEEIKHRIEVQNLKQAMGDLESILNHKQRKLWNEEIKKNYRL